LGFFQPRSQILEEVEACPLLHPDLDSLCRSLHDLKYPNLAQLYPALREIWMQRGSPQGEILLTLITPPSSRSALRLLYHRLKEMCPAVSGIALAWGREEEVYDHVGSPWIEMALRGLELRVGPTSFYQVGEQGAEAIFQVIEDWMSAERIELALDLYCGVGTFCLPLAVQGVKVVGVEAHPEAASLARENRDRNRISGVRIMCRTAEAALHGRLREGRYDLVLLDPPRSGLTRGAMEGVVRLDSPRIIYISCDPSTLARDLSRLMQGGYEPRSIQPLDLFPQTYHLETMVLLEKAAAPA
jgi:23S rRNA (uracil1939-C5)-methyltransferase